jgi:hypothetical protein
MKTFIFSFLFVATALSCSKETTNPTPEQCVRVKVIAEICGQAALQIQDPAFYQYGEDGWKSADGQVHDHSFFTEFNCTDYDYLQKTFNNKLIGAEFTMKFVENNDLGSCARCKAALGNRPTKSNWIKISENCASTK